MKVVEIYVERLKSYGDFSNRRVGLRAVLDSGENVRDAFLKLARECETLLDLRDIEADIELVERRKKEYEERYKELQTLVEEYNKIREELRSELRNISEELSKIERLYEEKELKLKESILEKLRRIRQAIGYDP